MTELDKPTLRISAYVLAKLNFLCHHGNTEIGGFCVSSKEDPLNVVDFFLLGQESGPAKVDFDEDAICSHIEFMFTEFQVNPNRCSRIWTHTHPTFKPVPSPTDEDTFLDHNGGNGLPEPDWMIMLILSGDCEWYARLRVNSKDVSAEQIMHIEIDWEILKGMDESETWRAEYDRCVFEKTYRYSGTPYVPGRYWKGVGVNSKYQTHAQHQEDERKLKESIDAIPTEVEDILQLEGDIDSDLENQVIIQQALALVDDLNKGEKDVGDNAADDKQAISGEDSEGSDGERDEFTNAGVATAHSNGDRANGRGTESKYPGGLDHLPGDPGWELSGDTDASIRERLLGSAESQSDPISQHPAPPDDNDSTGETQDAAI